MKTRKFLTLLTLPLILTSCSRDFLVAAVLYFLGKNKFQDFLENYIADTDSLYVKELYLSGVKAEDIYSEIAYSLKSPIINVSAYKKEAFSSEEISYLNSIKEVSKIGYTFYYSEFDCLIDITTKMYFKSGENFIEAKTKSIDKVEQRYEYNEEIRSIQYIFDYYYPLYEFGFDAKDKTIYKDDIYEATIYYSWLEEDFNYELDILESIFSEEISFGNYKKLF